MSSSLVIEAADSSGRWYILPGAENTYDLKVSNESDHAVLCKINLDEPAGAGSVTPSSLTLNAGESRSVSVSFKPDWLSLRDRKAIISARNAGGTVLATFVRDLVAATTTDCSISLAWKEEIAGDGMLRGFTLQCAIRSISSTPGIFEPEFTPHPALRFPEAERITLGPGESTTFDVPVIWNRSARDNEGWNHPRSIEVGVPVTHGRRTATAPWDLVQQHIEPYLSDSDRAPVIARRPPPPQFTTPGGGPPPVSPLATSAPPEATVGAPVTDSPAARMARSEMESGVTAGGLRLPPQMPPPPPPTVERRTISVAPGTLMLLALAFGAIAIVFVWMLRVPPQSSSISTAPVPTLSPALSIARPNAHPSPPKPRSSGATRTPIALPQPVTGALAAATSAPSAISTLGTALPPKANGGHGPHVQRAITPQRVSPIDRNALVQLANVSAEYARGGRQVRVFWDSYAQAHANVQLLDDRSTVIAQTYVGRRMGALLSLPRGYRGSVYVQVTAIGYDGERVVSSAFLSPR